VSQKPNLAALFCAVKTKTFISLYAYSDLTLIDTGID